MSRYHTSQDTAASGTPAAELVACKVASNRVVARGTYLMWLDAPAIAATAAPGQFAMLRCGEGLERVLRRPLSIHDVHGQLVAFLYRVMGPGTEWLSRRERDVIDVLGPLGTGFSIARGSRKLLLVAGGIGVAPLRFLAERAVAAGKDVTLLLGSRSSAELYPAGLLPRGLHIQTATEDGSRGEKGLVTAMLPRFAAGVDQVLACGPEAMYRALRDERDKLPSRVPVQVSLEARMGCGVGACLSCSVKTRRGTEHVCKDGPVFDLDDIDWGSGPVCPV